MKLMAREQPPSPEATRCLGKGASACSQNAVDCSCLALGCGEGAFYLAGSSAERLSWVSIPGRRLNDYCLIKFSKPRIGLLCW